MKRLIVALSIAAFTALLAPLVWAQAASTCTTASEVLKSLFASAIDMHVGQVAAANATLATRTSERDALQVQVNALTAQVASLTSQLNACLNP